MSLSNVSRRQQYCGTRSATGYICHSLAREDHLIVLRQGEHHWTRSLTYRFLIQEFPYQPPSLLAFLVVLLVRRLQVAGGRASDKLIERERGLPAQLLTPWRSTPAIQRGNVTPRRSSRVLVRHRMVHHGDEQDLGRDLYAYSAGGAV